MEALWETGLDSNCEGRNALGVGLEAGSEGRFPLEDSKENDFENESPLKVGCEMTEVQDWSQAAEAQGS